jgi:hypothetical protein
VEAPRCRKDQAHGMQVCVPFVIPLSGSRLPIFYIAGFRIALEAACRALGTGEIQQLGGNDIPRPQVARNSNR